MTIFKVTLKKMTVLIPTALYSHQLQKLFSKLFEEEAYLKTKIPIHMKKK